MSPVWNHPVPCPLSYDPVVLLLSFLTLGAVLFATASILRTDGRLYSIASSVMIAVSVSFPAAWIFQWIVAPSGSLDPWILTESLMVGGGVVGLVVSARRRHLDRAPNGPYNRLALGASLIAFGTLESVWGSLPFSWLPEAPYPGYPNPPPQFAEMINLTPNLPEMGEILLLAAALAVALPILFRSFMAPSLGCAITILAVPFLYSISVPFISLPFSYLWIGPGAIIAASGSLPNIWRVYFLPRYGPFWPIPQRSGQ